MIDMLVCAKSNDSFAENYSPSEAIVDARLDNSHAEKLAVIFPPWHGGGRTTQRLKQRLTSNNWSVLQYDFHDQILEPNADRVVKSYDTIRRHVSADIKSVQQEYSYQETKLIGISLGNLAMALVAADSEFSVADFIIPCSQLAGAMWEGARTQGLRAAMESQGYSRTELEERWRQLEPQVYAEAFRDKDVYSILAPKDRIILFGYQDEMVSKIQTAGGRTVNYYSRLGHAATIIKHSISGKI